VDRDGLTINVTFFNFFSKQFYLYPFEEQFLPNEINISDDLDRDFEQEELDTVIGKLSLGKAAGSDGSPNEAWKCMSAEHKGILLDALNKCWNTLSFPEDWSNVIICPIYKKGDKYNPNNYRPISLLNTGLKLYTMLISNRLNEWCDRNKKISDYQAAYRMGYGCEDHIFVLTAALQANVSKRRKVFALFIDLSKAFDSIRHKLLWSKQ
jgi:hypothetical protein